MHRALLFADASDIADTLAFQGDSFVWQTDWWKAIIIAFSALLFAFLLIKLSLCLLRLVGVLLCLAFGILGGYIGVIVLNSHIAGWLPENAQRFAPIGSAVCGFIVFYAVGAGIMSLVRKPAQPAGKEESK